MKFKVQITETASEQLAEAYFWLTEQTPLHAPAWHDGLIAAIASLADHPLRCPVVPEDEGFGDARQLLHGNKRHAYRIIFEVNAGVVTILQVRHSARHRG